MNEKAKPKAILCLDYSNLHYGLDHLGWSIDYLKLRRCFEQEHDVIDAYYYVGIHSYKSYFDKHINLNRFDPRNILKFRKHKKAKLEVFDSLKHKGYIVKTKEINSVWDNIDRKHKLKCNFDVEITLEALSNINDYDVFILISGDSDFVALVQYLKEKSKQVIAMSIKGRFSHELRKVIDNKRKYLDKLKDEIEYIKVESH